MKVLVVVDMQNDFVTGVLGTKEAEAVVQNVAEKIKAAINENERIIFTYDTHEDDYLLTEEGKNLPVPHCIRGTKGWELTPEIDNMRVAANIKNGPNVRCIRKETFGAIALAKLLGETESGGAAALTKMPDEPGPEQPALDRTGREWPFPEEITEVELVGLCTDICVISNAMLIKAILPNVHIVVDAACCAGVTPESHDTAIAAMRGCQIEVRNQGNEPWRTR